MSLDGAREAARGILKEHGVASAPVPVERIARQLGVRVQYAPLDNDLSGMAHIREGVVIVGVNSLHAPNRQRFTLAHELGHVVLHREILEDNVHVDRVLLRDRDSSAGLYREEIEANAFASELLMPAEFLDAMLGGRQVIMDDDEEISTLAKKFRVSESAMRFRFFR
jgi:Zn-dependent peptidase ImmA (M78 family)